MHPGAGRPHDEGCQADTYDQPMVIGRLLGTQLRPPQHIRNLDDVMSQAVV